MRRIGIAVLLAALVAAAPAAAKEGVKATLQSKIPLTAEAGTKVHARWTLWAVEDGQRRPFGAGDVFVRLVSATGEGSETAFTNGSGDFAATVTVPKGGIADVQIGLRGFSDASPKPASADMLFPITNDPMPGPARVAARAANERASAGSDSHTTAWSLVAAGGALSAFCLLVLRRARKR
jgi:hypothetical protein